MSNNLDKAVQALKDDPELAKKVAAANSPKERAEILTAAGVPVPTQEEVNARHAELADVSGGYTTTTVASLRMLHEGGYVPPPSSAPLG
jgi:hypothetical protein